MTAALTEYDDFFRFMPPARPGPARRGAGRRCAEGARAPAGGAVGTARSGAGAVRRRPHGAADPPPAPAVRGGCGRAVYGGRR
ncbi:hypothetical protein ACSCB1_01175 [Streptomyces europaeiscabiei]|uniref:hypothetical protein n=1 Tax=Streptomyces europaeiscabiei TaxID=146819 RepID=UPI00062832A2|nr:hypothetical protein [Streptomyces europaeiscabiei]